VENDGSERVVTFYSRGMPEKRRGGNLKSLEGLKNEKKTTRRFFTRGLIFSGGKIQGRKGKRIEKRRVETRFPKGEKRIT